MVIEEAEMLINGSRFTIKTFNIAMIGYNKETPWWGKLEYISGGECFKKDFYHKTVDGCLQMLKDYVIKFAIT